MSISPVVSPDGSTVYVASEDNNIYALEANASGPASTRIWSSNQLEGTQLLAPLSTRYALHISHADARAHHGNE